MGNKKRTKTEFISPPRNTCYELPGATDKFCLLKLWNSLCFCLFIYTVLSCSMCFTNYDLHNKQTHYCHSLIFKAVTVGKAPPLSLQPTTQEWAGCLQCIWGNFMNTLDTCGVTFLIDRVAHNCSFPSISSFSSHFQPFKAIYSHFLPIPTILAIPAIFSHFQSFAATSSNFQPFPDISSHVHPFPTIPAIFFLQFSPFQAISSNSRHSRPF